MKKHAEFKNYQREIFHFQLRLVVSIGFVSTLLAILVLRFTYLQAFQHGYYQTLAESNRITIVPIVPNRGLILDRNGVVLACTFGMPSTVTRSLGEVPSRVTSPRGR